MVRDTVVSCKNPIICSFLLFNFVEDSSVRHRVRVSIFDDFL